MMQKLIPFHGACHWILQVRVAEVGFAGWMQDLATTASSI
jgi:hypothetical protein